MDKYNPYIAQFLRSNSCENLVSLFTQGKNPAKKITEAWSLLEAAKGHVPNISDCRVIVIENSVLPCVGALFAYFTKAYVVSAIPNLDVGRWEEHCRRQKILGYPVQRLRVYKANARELKWSVHRRVLIVYARALTPASRLKETVFSEARNVYWITATDGRFVPDDFMNVPHTVYRDSNVMSLNNTIHVW